MKTQKPLQLANFVNCYYPLKQFHNLINIVLLVIFIGKNYINNIEKTNDIISLDHTRLLRNFLKAQFL